MHGDVFVEHALEEGTGFVHDEVWLDEGSAELLIERVLLVREQGFLALLQDFLVQLVNQEMIQAKAKEKVLMQSVI